MLSFTTQHIKDKETKAMKRFVFIFGIILLSIYTASSGLAVTVQYNYDQAGRMIEADYGDGKTITYTYDDNGNLLQRKTQTEDNNVVIVLSSASHSTTVADGDSITIYGSADPNSVTLETGGHAELLNFPGSNTVTILSDSSNFMVYRSGSMIIFEGTDGTFLKMPATLTSQMIVFDNHSTSLVITSGQVIMGDQIIDTTPSAVDTS